jgi:hypothetical protein
MNDEDFITFGERDGWGQSQPFGISSIDRRRHVYAIGQTGSGKTTLLRNLIVQHLAAGHGVGVIDPHGDLAEELLNHIPPTRGHHLCYFNPGDLAFPVAFNPLADVPKDDRHLVASGVVKSFKNIWSESWGPRLEHILYSAVATLLECPGQTLLGINRLLTDDDYRRQVLRKVKDPFLRDFWISEYEEYDARFRREAIAPVQNKIGQFLLNPVIRNLLGQVRNRISFPFIIDNSRIFIANLSKGRIGDEKANLLGSLLVTQFHLAAMARAKQPEESRRDFFLFVDEFQNFATDAFADMLAESRKYRMCLTLSHQYIDQLSPSVRQAVFGNVGTIVSFRVGFSDAEVLFGEFGKEIPPREYVNLSRFQTVVKMLENGEPHGPFRGKTFPPLSNPVGRCSKLVSHSRQKFGVQREIVEAKHHRWMASMIKWEDAKGGAKPAIPAGKTKKWNSFNRARSRDHSSRSKP